MDLLPLPCMHRGSATRHSRHHPTSNCSAASLERTFPSECALNFKKHSQGVKGFKFSRMAIQAAIHWNLCCGCGRGHACYVRALFRYGHALAPWHWCCTEGSLLCRNWLLLCNSNVTAVVKEPGEHKFQIQIAGVAGRRPWIATKRLIY